MLRSSSTLSSGLRARLFVGGIGSAAALLAAVFLTVPLPVDPMIYLTAAQDLSAVEPDHWATRIGLTVPAWILARVFGYSEMTVYAVPIIAFVVLCVAVGVLGRELFNAWVGVGGALLVATGPFVLPYATQLLPDLPSTALITLSFLFAWRQASSDDGSTRNAWMTGLAMGGAYLVRTTSLLFAPSLLLFAAIAKIRSKAISRMAAGAAVMLMLEGIVGWIAWGDPFTRLRSVIDRSSTRSGGSLPPTAKAAMEAQDDLFSSLSTLIELLWRHPQGQFTILLGLTLVVVALATRSRRLWGLVVWVVVPWLALAVVGTIRPSGDVVVIRLMLERYWSGILPPLILGGLGAMAIFVSKLSDRALNVAVSVVVGLSVAVFSVWGVISSLDWRGDWFVINQNDQYWDLREGFESGIGVETLAVSWRTSKLIEVYAHSPLGVDILESELVSDYSGDQPGGLLVDYVNSGRIDASSPLANPPSNYTLAAVEDRLRWGIWVLEESIDHVATARSWEIERGSLRYRILDGRDGGDPHPLTDGRVELERGEEVAVFDDSAPYGDAPSGGVKVSADDVVIMRVELVMTKGQIASRCEFHLLDGTRELVPAVGVRNTGPVDGEYVSICRPPETLRDQEIRPYVIVSGPAQVSIERVKTSVVSGVREFE